MKVTIDIDCTPEEARRFLGLPDLDKAYQATLDAITARMREAVGEFDAESLLKSWTSGGRKAWKKCKRVFAQVSPAPEWARITKRE